MMEKKLKRRVITRSIAVAATLARTFQALIDPKDLKRWWGVNEAVIAPRKDGIWSLGWHAYGQDNFYATTGFIEKITNGRELRLRDVMYFRPDMSPVGPTMLAFRLNKKRKKTVVTVQQTALGSGKRWEWYYHAVEDGWEKSLWSLKKYLERKAR